MRLLHKTGRLDRNLLRPCLPEEEGSFLLLDKSLLPGVLNFVCALPNKPLQRTQSPQGNWRNINEPLVRRPRR